MPVTQLQDSGGLGSIIGSVGGFLAANPERKQAKADREYKQKRDLATDARTDATAKDTHDNIQSEIASRTATATQNASDATNTQFQNGAYGKLSALLRSKPQGVTAQQWIDHVQSQVPTLGLTDPKLLGTLYGEAQDVLAKDQTTQNASFAANEMTLPGDPQKKLSILMKRLQVEKGKPGFDLKPTQQMIQDTQKQITEAQAAAHQNAVETRQSHHDTVLENQGAERLGIEHQNANKPREGDNPNSIAAQHFAWDRHTWNMTHNPDGTAKGAAKKEKAPSIPQQRGADADAAGAAIGKPGADRDAIVKHYAAKWNITVDKADEELPG